jgi:hypothetical protein
MRQVGMVRKNKLEIPAVFFSGKQREISSSILVFTRDLTLVLYVPARNKTIIILSLQHG